jgi:hypothetical protein
MQLRCEKLNRQLQGYWQRHDALAAAQQQQQQHALAAAQRQQQNGMW